MLPQKPSNKQGRCSNKQERQSAPSRQQQTKDSRVRAIGEDDDGYDPYTDWHGRPAPEPLFEEDPWH